MILIVAAVIIAFIRYLPTRTADVSGLFGEP
jgi:hypothetical protein